MKKHATEGRGENPAVDFKFRPKKGQERIIKESLPSDPRVNFINNLGKSPSWKEFLGDLKNKQERLSRETCEQDYAHLAIKSSLPIGIVLTSDWHMGARGTDYETWERHMELIKNEPLAYMFTLSNTIDNFIFPSGMFEQMENPSSQQRMIKDFAHDFKEKILAVVGSRCHEGWTKQTTDVEVNYSMFEENISAGVPWLPTGGVVEIKLNGISYKFGLLHKSKNNSVRCPTSPGQWVHDLRWPVDIVAIAHNHIKQILIANKYEGEFQKKLAILRTGTYEIKDAFAEGEGWGAGDIGSPIVILMPDRKHILPFYDLEDGISYLRTFRELYERA